MMWAWESPVMASPHAQVARRTGSTLLAGEIILSVVCCVAVPIIWAATGGPFWPLWVWSSLALPIALQLAWRRAWAQPRGARRGWQHCEQDSKQHEQRKPGLQDAPKTHARLRIAFPGQFKAAVIGG